MNKWFEQKKQTFEQKLWKKIMNKSCGQNSLTKAVNIICKNVNKIGKKKSCEQEIWTRVVKKVLNKIDEQKLQRKIVNKRFEQK